MKKIIIIQSKTVKKRKQRKNLEKKEVLRAEKENSRKNGRKNLRNERMEGNEIREKD